MKRKVFPLILACLVGTSTNTIMAQDTGAQAAAIAEKEAAEERYKRLNTAIEDLLAAQAAQQKRLNAVADEIRSLREDLSRQQNGFAAHEDLRRLAQKVQEIDDKREADRKLIIEELQKLLKTPPVMSPTVTANPPSTKPSNGNEIQKGYEHVVESRQTLSEIVQAYREQKGVKVTLKQVLDANPGLNPNKLFVGQKIFIPDSSK